jgi:hypothetical protein
VRRDDTDLMTGVSKPRGLNSSLLSLSPDNISCQNMILNIFHAPAQTASLILEQCCGSGSVRIFYHFPVFGSGIRSRVSIRIRIHKLL